MKFPLIWIPLIPLIGAALNLLIGRKLSRRAVLLIAICGAVGALLISSWAVFCRLIPQGDASGGVGGSFLYQDVFDWIAAGKVEIGFGLYCDSLTAVMLFTITFVGALIHIYSAGYMSKEPDLARFLGYLNLFMGAMLILVLGDNLVVVFIGWEGVGVCSYLLIGFWYDRSGPTELGLENAAAGKKAFIVNRIGDLAFILGLFVLFYAVGSLDIATLRNNPEALLSETSLFGIGSISVAGAAALLLFIGATGKSAQIPLFVWLPDAMAGPTPVSALIHAATMVTAGVYLVARLNFLFLLSPAVMGLIAIVGALTALLAATIGLAQNDIKKVLAYSTVSQLGYMFMAVGSGAFVSGIFHVFTHAFFKACLFLGAGAVIHALHGEQDIRRMGGLSEKLPTTRMTFLISTLAISGIPFLSGFFSKDEILWKAISSNNPSWGSFPFSLLIFLLGLIAAVFTAFYMFRLYSLVFCGPSRVSPEREKSIHRPSSSMTLPLVILAGGAAIVGFLGLPELVAWAVGTSSASLFEIWLGPVLMGSGAQQTLSEAGGAAVGAGSLAASHAAEAGLMILSALLAVGFSVLGYRTYRLGPSEAIERLVERFPRAYFIVHGKYFLDEAYHMLLVLPFRKLAWLCWRVVDVVMIDLLAVKVICTRVIAAVGFVFSRLQTGSLRQYVAVAALAVAAILHWVATPSADFEVLGDPVGAGEVVVFRAVRDANSEHRELEYRWDFDGDGRWDEPKKGIGQAQGGWSRRDWARHVFEKPGVYKTILKVRDRRWRTTESKALTLRVILKNVASPAMEAG